MSTDDTSDHFWIFTVLDTAQEAVCQKCRRSLVVAYQSQTVAYQSDTVAKRTALLVQFMRNIDAHEYNCWGYVYRAMID